jgi:hypothetical protein
VEELPSDRDSVAEEEDPKGDDDDLFGIDLGPAGDRREPEPDDEVEATPVRPATKTLTERLATAAADRESGDAPDDGEPPEG